MTQNHLKQEKFWVIMGKEVFISPEILHCNYSGNGNNAFKSVVWGRFWSWTLAIFVLLSSDIDKFKSETQIKTLKNVFDKKQVGIKEAIKMISSLNASRKLLVSEVLKLVKLILLGHTTIAARERLFLTLCRVKMYLRSCLKNLWLPV